MALFLQQKAAAYPDISAESGLCQREMKPAEIGLVSENDFTVSIAK